MIEKIERKERKETILQNIELNLLKQKTKLPQSHSKAPYLYNLPKIRNLAYLSTYSKSYIIDLFIQSKIKTKDFLNKLKIISLEEIILYSFDVVS